MRANPCRPKVVHRAGKMNAAGEVSALCFKRPRPIDLARANYTMYGEPTCPRCRLAMASKRATDPDSTSVVLAVDPSWSTPPAAAVTTTAAPPTEQADGN